MKDYTSTVKLSAKGGKIIEVIYRSTNADIVEMELSRVVSVANEHNTKDEKA